MMYAILAEHASDADVLASITRRRLAAPITIKKKGYDGCGNLRAKGARDIRAWINAGVLRFIICHDADGRSPESIRELVAREIIKPAGVSESCCIAVPVQEIESWLIADETAIQSIANAPGFKGHGHPESLAQPKEWLKAQLRAAKVQPRYVPDLVNERVAGVLRLDVLERKCPSFRNFVAQLDRWRQSPAS
ncbi:MAG: DUF4276 family protein [Planctomycetes bacterium]|nr:DUF4276 family protein [Planctomycetota bacterium]